MTKKIKYCKTPLFKDSDPIFSGVDILFIVFTTLLLFLMLFVTLFSKCSIIGNSMKNKLHDGEDILIFNYSSSYNTGDIVVLDVDYKGNSERIVKRVIATQGERFYFLKDGINVYLYKETQKDNFEKVEEPYIYEPMLFAHFSNEVFKFYSPQDENTIYTVPSNSILFLGDNRNVSIDSRKYSFASTDTIIGKMVCKIEKNTFLGILVALLIH